MLMILAPGFALETYLLTFLIMCPIVRSRKQTAATSALDTAARSSLDC